MYRRVIAARLSPLFLDARYFNEEPSAWEAPSSSLVVVPITLFFK